MFGEGPRCHVDLWSELVILTLQSNMYKVRAVYAMRINQCVFAHLIEGKLPHAAIFDLNFGGCDVSNTHGALVDAMGAARLRGSGLFWFRQWLHMLEWNDSGSATL